MIRLSFATSALLAMLLSSCVHHRNTTVRSEYRTETTSTQEGKAEGADVKPGTHSQQSETIRTHEESKTTEEIRK